MLVFNKIESKFMKILERSGLKCAGKGTIMDKKENLLLLWEYQFLSKGFRN